jgi:queuine/archaeosine tRNA-ribosyltransferase
MEEIRNAIEHNSFSKYKQDKISNWNN